MQNSHKLALYLEETDTPIGRWTNFILSGFVLLSSAIFVAQTYPLSPEIDAILRQINTAILIIFSGEYLLRLWAAERKLRYIFSLYSIIDLIVILPVFLGAFDISFLRIFRWFRVLRLLRFVEGQVFFGSYPEDSLIITRILFTLFSIIFVYSGLIYQVEHSINPEQFSTFLDAVYFSVVTMTTVGFGDVTPLSEGGRLMTVLMILTGIALIPGQLGALIKELVKNSNQVESHCTVCGLPRHDRDAQFCKICGTKLKNN